MVLAEAEPAELEDEPDVVEPPADAVVVDDPPEEVEAAEEPVPVEAAEPEAAELPPVPAETLLS